MSGSIEDLGHLLRWDSADIADEVSKRAVAMSKLGIERGSVVAIAHGNSAYFFADLFAVWTLGATAACLDNSLTPGELRTIIGFAEPALLLIEENAPAVEVGIPVRQLSRLRTVYPTRCRTAAWHPEDTALILFTSGTTGTPKGVVLSYGAIKKRTELNAAVIGKSVLARTLLTLPTHFGHGLIGNALTPLFNGGHLVIAPSLSSLGKDLACIVDSHNITFLSSVPALWRIILRKQNQPSGTSLRRIHVGSAPLTGRLWSEIASWSRAEVVNCYGMTEAANWIGGASSKEGIADGLLGRCWGGSFAVLDASGAIKASGEGEVLVKTPSLMLGYLRQPNMTAASMLDGWFRTGDSGRLDADGRLWLTGRIKDEINRAGFKIQPAEVDILLERHPAVAEACVFGIPEPVGSEVVGAAIRLKPYADANGGQLQSWCRQSMRREAVPERWFFIDEIPRTSRGKVSRDLVRQRVIGNTLAMSADDEPDGVAPDDAHATLLQSSDSIRAAVKNAWTSVLGNASFTSDVSWENAGGDSLGALRLWEAIERSLGAHLPFDAFAKIMSPTQLMDSISGTLQQLHSSSEKHKSLSDLPLVVLFPHAHGDVPSLVRFRAEFDGNIGFIVVRYPSAEELIATRSELDTMVRSTVSQIIDACGNRKFSIVGYSYGGFIALETARQLLASGANVQFLGIIDSRLKSPSKRRAVGLGRMKKSSPRSSTTTGSLSNKAAWWAVQFLVRVAPRPVLKKFHHLVNHSSTRIASECRIQLAAKLRARCLRYYKPAPFGSSVTLFRSEEFSPELPDHGWRSLCRNLSVVPIEGDHRTLIEPRCFRTLCRELAAAVAPSAQKPSRL